jgi:hydroxyacylglutathione hydrolase
MFLRFFDEGLAQASFLVACGRTKEAVVVDPRRDIDIYVAAARQHGLSIVYAIETHIHADFVSGARELAATGARPVAGPGAGLSFPHHEAQDHEHLRVGDIDLELLHTPGHTPEHITIVVREPGQPVRALTGDLLFVGAVGRPDLLGSDQARALAHDLHRSLFDIMLPLPDDVEVHPGHGAGSLCGAGIGKEPYSTIGRERQSNPMLQHRSVEAFVAAVLADLPETPPYFPRMKRVNHDGPAVLGLVEPVEAPPPIGARAVASALAANGVVLDLRSSEEYGAGHVTNAIHIAFGSKVGYWAGWVIEPGTRVILVISDERQAVEVRRQLLRVGIDAVDGVLRGDRADWQADGLLISSTPQITVRELETKRHGAEAVTVLDVRSAREWKSGHINGAVNIPVGEVPVRMRELQTGGPVAVICEGGFRSSLASSLLERAGVSVIQNVTGGMAAYRSLELTR